MDCPVSLPSGERLQAQCGDLVDFGNRRFELLLGGILQSLLEGFENCFAIAVFHCHNKREVEPGLVGIVELREFFKFFRRALIDAGARLLAGRISRQLSRNRRFAREVGVRASLGMYNTRAEIDTLVDALELANDLLA